MPRAKAPPRVKGPYCERGGSPSKSRLLGNILDEYTSGRVQRGLCGTQSAHDERLRLRHWLGGSLQEDLGKLTTKRAAGYYERLIVTPTRKTGQPPAAATHRFYLNLAKRLFGWAVRKGYLRESPFTEIQPVGRPTEEKGNYASRKLSGSSPFCALACSNALPESARRNISSG